MRPQRARAKNGVQGSNKGDKDACTGTGKGGRADRCGGPSNAGGYGGVPKVQRRAGQGGGCPGGRPPPPRVSRPTRAVLGAEMDRLRVVVGPEQRGPARATALGRPPLAPCPL